MAEFEREPNPQDPAVLARLGAIRRRMYRDLASHLPDDWLKNSNSANRNDFHKHLLTSDTMRQIIETVSWTMLCIEKEEETMRARSE